MTDLVFLCIKMFVELILGVGVIYLAYQANKIAKSNLELAKEQEAATRRSLEKDDRDIFIEVYSKISKSIGLIIEKGRVNEEALALVWKARDTSRLFFPEKLHKYVEGLFKKIHTAWVNENFLNKASNDEKNDGKREKILNSDTQFLKSMLDEKPYEVFSAYLKINIEVN